MGELISVGSFRRLQTSFKGVGGIESTVQGLLLFD